MTTVITRPLAATGPETAEQDELQTDLDRSLHQVCEEWVAWQRTRRLFGPKPLKGNVLGKMSSTRAMPRNTGGPDAPCSAEMAAFHIAYTCQPDALDKHVFEAYYVHRIKPVKVAASALGVSQPHFYRLLSAFRQRVSSAAQAIQADAAVFQRTASDPRD